MIASLNREHGITGVHSQTASLSNGLTELGHECRVVSPFSGSRKWLALFAVRPLLLNHISRTWGTLWYRHWHEKALRWNLRNHLERDGANAIVAQCPVSAHAALQVRRELGLQFKVALVCHFNHSEAQEYRRSGDLSSDRAFRQMMAYEDAVLREVDQVIYVSEWARSVVEKERGITPRSSTVIHNGIADIASGKLKRQALGLADDDLVLINVGTLEPRKNQLGLVELFVKISQRWRNAKLLLVGEGEQRGEIEAEVAARKLREKVELLGARSDVAELLSLSDLYVHYARLENCPVVLLECARAGLAFAAPAVGGIPEIQELTGNKITVESDDVSKSLAALEPVLNDATHRKFLGWRARGAFLEHFTTEAMTRTYIRVLGLGEERCE